MTIQFKITEGKTRTIIYLSSKMSFITNLITYSFILCGFAGFYLNHHYFGDSIICSFVCGFFAMGGFLYGANKQKKITKQELKDYIDTL